MDRSFTLSADPTFPPPTWLDTDPTFYAADGTVDTAALPDDGVAMGIPRFPGIVEGDLVRMCTQPVDGHQQAVYGAWRTVGPDLSVQPTLRKLTLCTMATQSETVRIHYEVQRRGVRFLSMPLLVRLAFAYRPPKLSAPRLRTRLVNGELSRSAGRLSLEMKLPADLDVVGETVTIYILGTDLAAEDTFSIRQDQITVDDPPPADDEEFFWTDAPAEGAATVTVTRRTGRQAGFSALNHTGEALRCWFTLSVGDDLMVSAILILQVEGDVPQPDPEPLLVGDDAEIHAEPCFIAIGKPPRNLPPHAVLLRTPTGGKPPYAFASGNPLAVSVDDTGRIVPTGNGVSVVTVTDAAGNTGSFLVKVTGATVLMPVRSPKHVDASFRQTLLTAAPSLASIWYMPGVMAQLAHLRGLWKQYVDRAPSLAKRMGFDEESPTEAVYWVFDSDNLSHFRVNLNALEEGEVVERVDFTKGNTERHFIAMVETNLWCGFNGWYVDGAHAKTYGQPWYTADYSVPADS